MTVFFPKACSSSCASPVCFETFSIGWCGACNFSATTSRNTYACYGLDRKHGTEFADPALLSAKSGHSYVLSANERTLPDMRNVWSTVKRPAMRLTVTSVAAMRSSFCFRTCGDNVLAVSDRCEHCLAHGWAQCTNAEASPYQAGPKVAKSRSDRTVISTERVKLARAVAPAG